MIFMFFSIYPKIQGFKDECGRKTIFLKLAGRLFIYPVGQKFHQNDSSSLRFRDKHVFSLYTEIQHGRQK